MAAAWEGGPHALVGGHGVAVRVAGRAAGVGVGCRRRRCLAQVTGGPVGRSGGWGAQWGTLGFGPDTISLRYQPACQSWYQQK